MIFGDIMKYLTPDVLNSFDKIYQFGHLTIYKNNKENNRIFLKSEGPSYKDVFSTDIICVFDELEGIQKTYDALNISTYKSRDYADISKAKHRFTLTNVGLSKEQLLNNNFDYQIFYYDNGCIYRDYFENNTLKTDEFNYIHFSSRKMDIKFDNENCFYITNKGFIKKDSITTKEIIEKLNKKSAYKDKLTFYYRRYIDAKRKINKILTTIKEK